MPDIVMLVASGLSPHPGNRPKKAVFTFESGGSIVLEGAMLQLWFNAYASMIQTIGMLSNLSVPDSKDVRDTLRRQEREFSKKIKNEDD